MPGSSANDLDRLDARRRAHEDLRAITDQLIAEFAGAVSSVAVTRHVARAREELLAAGVRAGLGAAVEAMARLRLRTLVPAHGVAG